MTIKKSTTATLTTTITALTVLDSLVPRISSAVSSRIIAAAGRLAIPGVGSQWLCCHTCGMFQLKSERRMNVKYPDQPTLTVDAPSAYSKTSPQPTIHARTSPSVAYVYV